MNKVELLKQAELVINPIEVGTNLKFKVATINVSTKLCFREDGVDETFVDNWTVYTAVTQHHKFWITHFHNHDDNNFKLIYRKNAVGSRDFTEWFDTSLELITFLNQSKLKK